MWVAVGCRDWLGSIFFTGRIFLQVLETVTSSAALGLQESPNAPLLLMMRRSCIGLSALFIFWGGLLFDRSATQHAGTRFRDGDDCHLERGRREILRIAETNQ